MDLDPDPVFNPQLAARDSATAGPTTLGDYLAFLAPLVGALVADRRTAGSSSRRSAPAPSTACYALDPADVAYAPVWVEELPRGNIVTVRYTGDQSESVTSPRRASIALYGERPETIDTPIVSSPTPPIGPTNGFGRSAFPHWNIPEAPVLRGLDLQLGVPILLDGMPASAPFEPGLRSLRAGPMR